MMAETMPDEIKQKQKHGNQNLKHMTENHDAHLDKILPEFLHRGDIVPTNRLLGYTDAMMATCATFLVLPFRNLKEMHDGQMLGDYMHEKRTELIMFFIGFLVICTIWESTNIRSIVIKRLDDFLVLLSVTSMLATTVLPFSLALQGNYPQEIPAIVVTTVVLLLIELFDLIMIIYAFASPRLLHYALSKWTPEERSRFRKTMFINPIFNFVFIAAAGLFCIVDYHVSWVLFSLIILSPLARKLIFYIRRHVVKSTGKEKCNFFWFFTKGNIGKERVECFTDAATAIIACVLILDITVEEFPKEKNVSAHGLLSTLNHMQIEFKIFFSTYVIVSLLWYVNHTILHLFHTITVVTLYLQKIFLVFLCLTPLYSNMLAKYLSVHDENTHVAITYASLIMLASSMCNFFMLMWGFYRRERVFHAWASNKCLKTNLNQHLYILTKTLTIPIWSLISFIGSFFHGTAPGYIMIVSFFGIIVTFIVLKLAFLNHIGKAGIEQFDRPNLTDNITKTTEEKDVAIGMEEIITNKNQTGEQRKRKDSYEIELDEEMMDAEVLNEEADEEM